MIARPGGLRHHDDRCCSAARHESTRFSRMNGYDRTREASATPSAPRARARGIRSRTATSRRPPRRTKYALARRRLARELRSRCSMIDTLAGAARDLRLDRGQLAAFLLEPREDALHTLALQAAATDVARPRPPTWCSAAMRSASERTESTRRTPPPTCSIAECSFALLGRLVRHRLGTTGRRSRRYRAETRRSDAREAGRCARPTSPGAVRRGALVPHREFDTMTSGTSAT
jgi:hypothetical protein